MKLFGCGACAAKDEEVKHLLAQIDWLQRQTETLQKQVVELAEPGIVSRLAPRATPALRPADPRKVQTFPGYEPTTVKPEVEVS